MNGMGNAENNCRVRFKKEMRKLQKRKEMPDEARIRALSNPDRMWRLRVKFLDQCRRYFGVPYARRYWKPEDDMYNSKLFLDCCGLVRRVLKDLKRDFGFKIGPWNQAYMYDTLPITVETEEEMKPGDLVFIRAIHYNPKCKKQKHNMVHVEIWTGEAPKTIGARWQRGVIQEFDSYKFTSKSYHSMEYIFKSIDTWLMGICRSHCPEHQWRTRAQKFKPSKKSIFTVKQKKKNEVNGSEENGSGSDSEEEEAADSPAEDSQNEDEADTAGDSPTRSDAPPMESEEGRMEEAQGNLDEYKDDIILCTTEDDGKNVPNVARAVTNGDEMTDELQAIIAQSLLIQSIDSSSIRAPVESEVSPAASAGLGISRIKTASRSTDVERDAVLMREISSPFSASVMSCESSPEVLASSSVSLTSSVSSQETLPKPEEDTAVAKDAGDSGVPVALVSGTKSPGGSKPGSPARSPLRMKPISIQHEGYSSLRASGPAVDAFKLESLENPDAKISVMSILQYSIMQNQKRVRTHMHNRMAISGSGMNLSPSSSRTSSPAKSRRSPGSLSSSSDPSLETLNLSESEENLSGHISKGAHLLVAGHDERSCYSDSEAYGSDALAKAEKFPASAPTTRPNSAPDQEHDPTQTMMGRPGVKFNQYCSFVSSQDELPNNSNL